MNEQKIFQLSAFLASNNEVFHLAKVTLSSESNLKIHEHEFPEIFWIERGEGIHILNNTERQLSKGMLCMIRPSDKYSLSVKGDELLEITKVVFKNEDLNHFKRRYFPDSLDYFWKTGEIPFYRDLNQEQLNELFAITNFLMMQPKNYINFDIFLLKIFKLINQNKAEDQKLPHWLAYAFDNYTSPDNYRKGVSGFVELTNRTSDHVNRILKHYLNQTLTETVNQIRLEYAASQLLATNTPIKTICYNCGFDTLGYYYKIFKKQYGVTPKEYRQNSQLVS